MTIKPYLYYNHLGSFSPYYTRDENNQIHLETNIYNALKKSNIDLKLDNVAISEVLNNRFMLGDRTIVQGVKRNPWMAKPNMSYSDWEFYKLKKHDEKIKDEEYIADKLFNLICEEIQEYVGNNKKIGILLSGGMDSRIVAGSLDYLIKMNKIKSTTVTAFTWGNPDSRDVIYARMIADRLKWNWKHYIVTAEDLWNNFKISGQRGAEYSGIHLHAIPQIKKDMKVDVMLVGSYGDSIGRAEYSGSKIKKLKPVVNSQRNFKSFIKNRKYQKLKNVWETDINRYHKLFLENKDYQQKELDYQLHYMRRMLNACMEILNEKTPTYQVFTSPKIYEFMWSLNPNCRSDNIYSFILEKFITELSDIPWARTGVPYLKKGKSDSFTKGHHSYSIFIQNQMLKQIEKRALSDRIEMLNLFNIDAIRVIFRLIKLKPNYNFDYLERLTWLVSLDFFLEEINYEAKSKRDNYSIFDKFNSFILEPLRYVSLNVIRRIF